MAGQEQVVNAARFVVAGEGGGGAPGGSATGAFTLDRDAMTAELANLQKLQRRIADLLLDARPMWAIQSPGNDPASLRNTDASNKSGVAYRDSLIKQRDFLGVFIAKIQGALGIYVDNDEQAAQNVKATGDGGHF